MPKYPVKQKLRHDGKKYAAGDTVEMDAKAAKRLAALGVLDEALAEKKSSGTGGGDKDPGTKTGDKK